MVPYFFPRYLNLDAWPTFEIKDLNLGYNFQTRRGRAFILHIYIPCDKTFHMVPEGLTLKFDLLFENFNLGCYNVFSYSCERRFLLNSRAIYSEVWAIRGLYEKFFLSKSQKLVFHKSAHRRTKKISWKSNSSNSPSGIGLQSRTTSPPPLPDNKNNGDILLWLLKQPLKIKEITKFHYRFQSLSLITVKSGRQVNRVSSKAFCDMDLYRWENNRSSLTCGICII